MAIRHQQGKWPRPPLATRFWNKVQRGTGDACWLWTGKRDHFGYGIIWNGSGPLYAHRVSWELEHGQIQRGLCVCHRCDVPACVRPSHLFLGTHADNMRDKVAKGRQGAARGSASGKAKLTDDAVRLIRNTPRQRGMIVTLARLFGITPARVKALRAGHFWQHLENTWPQDRPVPHLTIERPKAQWQ